MLRIFNAPFDTTPVQKLQEAQESLENCVGMINPGTSIRWQVRKSPRPSFITHGLGAVRTFPSWGARAPWGGCMNKAHRELVAYPLQIIPRGLFSQAQITGLGKGMVPASFVINGQNFKLSVCEATRQHSNTCAEFNHKARSLGTGTGHGIC